MSEAQEGLYQKYKVERLDGKNMSMGCFVLELKDPKARTAIVAYANELEKENASDALAYDLKTWVARYDPIVQVTPSEIIKNFQSNMESTGASNVVRTFDRVVLLKPRDELTAETLYIVDPTDTDIYKMDGDIELDAFLTVDLTNLNKYKEEKKAKEEKLEAAAKEDPMLSIVVTQIETDFGDSPYTDKLRYWKDHVEHYEKLLKDNYDLIREKFLSDYYL